MNWQYTDSTKSVVTYTDGNGTQYSALATAPEIEAWLAAGNTIAPCAGPSWSDRQAQARAALSDSDITVLRCAENGLSVPAAWAIYRKALRTIVGAASGDATQSLPTKPAYPTGT